MNRVMMLKGANALTERNNEKQLYSLVFVSKEICTNLNQIIYTVKSSKLKHDLSKNLTIQELINLYE